MADLKSFAVSFGWRFYHPFLSMHSERGFPDVVLTRDRIIFAELKRVGGKPTATQTEWLDALRAAGGEAYLWTADDWPEIVHVLTGKAVIG